MVELHPVSMSDKIYDELVSIVRQSYKDACILYIDRLSNPSLEIAFQKRCDSFKDGANVIRLFHGTNAAAVKSVCTNGYCSSLNKRKAYGPGTYFSSNCSYSKEYTDTTDTGESFIIVNSVALGTNTVSVGAKYTGDSGGDGRNIFVIRYDDAALPQYVICFHKKAVQ